jgi:hypothetical protein
MVPLSMSCSKKPTRQCSTQKGAAKIESTSSEHQTEVSAVSYGQFGNAYLTTRTFKVDFGFEGDAHAGNYLKLSSGKL